MKISTRIILAIILSSLIVVAAVSYVSLTSSKRVLLEEAEQDLINIIMLEGKEIDASISNVSLLCDTLEVQLVNEMNFEVVTNDYDAMQAMEEKLINPWIETIDLFGQKSGWIAFDSLVIPGGHTIFAYETDGEIVREPEYDIREFGYENEVWYSDAIEYGEVWTAPYLWEDWDNAMIITYSRPVDINGTVIGVIGSEFFLDNLIDRIAKIKVYETGYITLMDEEFNFIYHPSYTGENLWEIDDGSLDYLAEQIKDSPEDEGIFNYEFEGNKKIMAYYKLDNGWIMTANPIEKEIYTNLNIMRSSILITTGIALMSAIALALLQGRSIAKPLEILANKTVELSNGEYNPQQKFQDTNIYEISMLQKNFKSMEKNIITRENELKQFVYVASHDLQEPLRMVTSYLQIIEKKYKGKLDEKADTYIFYAVDGAKRMKILIRDLLLYSRLSEEFDFIMVDLNEVFGEVKNNLSISIKESKAIVNCDHLPTIKGDRTRMVQLFQNLISNAVKYRSDEAPIIDISSITISDHYKIIVKDNGIGFKQENADRIFEVFKRLHTREQYSGTGVGLSVCKKIMLKHNGEINAESSPNEGSKFIVKFPIN